MMSRTARVLTGLAVWCVSSLCSAQEAASKTEAGKTAPASKAATVKAEKGRLTATVSFKGTVESDATAEAGVTLKGWSGPLVVEKAIAHGAAVQKDDVLLTFDSEKLSQAIRAAREERELARLAIRQAELELPLLKESLPMELRAAEQERKHTADDLDYFLKIKKPSLVDQAHFTLKSSEFQLQQAKEELVQLQKMYRDKDLTEETEQIVLRRYQHGLEAAEFSLREAKVRTDRSLNVDIPRLEESTRLAAAKANVSWERSREQLPLSVHQKELTLQKLKFDEARALERLADLEKDLGLLTVRSPAAGVAYYGRYARGQWTVPSGAPFQKGATVSGSDGMLTIVSGGRLLLHAEVDETEVAGLNAGQPALISPTRFPGRKLPGKVERVATIPLGGKFEVLIALDGAGLEGIVPGLTGSARITTAQRDHALLVPSSAVFEEPETNTSYVYLAAKPPVKKTVKIGLVAGGKTEITDGLAEGDEILAEKP